MSVTRVSKIRLYPTVSQEVTLLETLSLCKDAWNALKAVIQDEYRRTGKTLGYIDLIRRLPPLKRLEPRYA